MPRVKPNSRQYVSKALSNEQLEDYFGDEDFDYNFEELDFSDDLDDNTYHQESKDEDWNDYSSSHEDRKNEVRKKRKSKKNHNVIDEWDYY